MITTIGYGVSESLLSVFDGLRQITCYTDEGADAPRKHHDSDIDKVVQYICCRNYGFLCRECCFLSWAVQQAYRDEQYNEPLYRFFWLDDITTPAAFRRAFAESWQSGGQQVELTASVLHLVTGNTTFDISPTRSGVLAVMMEFIATADPQNVQHLKSLRDGTAEDIDTISRQLQKSIYSYLKDHLPEVQEHNRYRYVADWMNSQTLSPETINDADVLSFWQDANEDHSPNKPSHVRFETAVDDVMDTLLAIAAIKLQDAAKFGYSVGTNADKGELDLSRIGAPGEGGDDDVIPPGHVQSALFDSIDTDISLIPLTQMPKCLTQAQTQLLQPLVRHKTHIKRFKHTLLRLQVFGPWQAVISQAKRKSADTVTVKLSEPPADGYRYYLRQLNDNDVAISQVRGCLHHLLLPVMPQWVFSEMLEQLPPPPQQVKLWLSENMTHTDMPAFIEQAALQWPALKSLIEDNAKRFKANNKAGFKTLPGHDDCDPYYHALMQLDKIAALLANHRQDLTNWLNDEAAAQIFASDVSIFSARFRIMYGEVHV